MCRQAKADTFVNAFYFFTGGSYIMAWVYLIFAGLIEVFWAVCMKLSEGFTVFKFSAMTVAGLIASFLLLSQATKTLPIGTAYAIWTGIGALGAVIIGIIMFNEPASPVRLFFVLLLLVGIIGLKLTSH
jgi:quaternary ammonium compound-resistance protein SugE